MHKKYTSFVLKLLSLGLMIAAGSFWASASVVSRPKYKDEQTLVGGTVWSQIVIPIGLVMSKTVGETLDIYVEAYFLVSGFLLLFATGIFLIIGESKTALKRRARSSELTRLSGLQSIIKRPALKYDKIYLCIGILSLLAGVFTFADFILLVV